MLPLTQGAVNTMMTTRWKILTALALTAGLMASAAATLAEQAGDKTVKLVKDWKGFQSKAEKAERLVVGAEADWQKIWAKANGNISPMPKLPQVDFKKEMVLAVFMGQKPSGGFAVTITKVVPTDKGLNVHVRETAPDGIATAVITSPWHLAVVPRTEGKVTFVTDK
jgi:hypothetical protein